MLTTADDNAPLRRALYALLIVVACGSAAGRIMTVSSKSGKTPFLSANDRSRWSTLRALVDQGTFVLDDVIFRPDGRRDGDWYSIDLVRHRGSDGQEHYYSSKPTLLTVLLAGVYWLASQATGVSLTDDPLYMGRLLLLIYNIPVLAGYLYVLSRVIERYGTTDWGRLFVFVCAAFGTFITTFSVTLNNHTFAAATALFAVHAALHIAREGKGANWRWFAWAGLNAALTVANELPALAFLALLGAILLWRAPRKTLLAFTPPVILVAAAALGTNYYAHGSWKTPYAHRGDGKVIATLLSTDAAIGERARLDAGILPPNLRKLLGENGIYFAQQPKIEVKTPEQRWTIWTAEGRRYAVVFRETGTDADAIDVHEWDNWYDYEGTYWTDEKKQGVDRGEPSRLVYAFHCLAGHHGLFSLTPMWLLAVWGGVVWLRPTSRGDGSTLPLPVGEGRGEGLDRSPSTPHSQHVVDLHPLRIFAAAVALLTLVVLAFYIVQRPLADRNYGGVASGLRWMFWFTPLWLILMLPAADQLSRTRLRRGVALALLAVSVFSAHYASLNPWSHPWLFNYWTDLGWIAY